MCNNCQYKGIAITLPPNLAAENEELKKQVAALTQALETQNRENQPYIKKLEAENIKYKGLLEHAKGLLERSIVHPEPDSLVFSDIFHFVNNDLPLNL